jgi:hypothetical protein
MIFVNASLYILKILIILFVCKFWEILPDFSTNKI